MSEEKARTTVKAGSDRSFALVFAAVFLIVGLWPLWHGGPVRAWALAGAVLLAAVGVARPGLLAPLNRAWFRFGMWLSRFTTPIVMTIVFVAAVVPTGILLRLFGKDPMRRRFDANAATYWIERDEQPGSMKEQY